MGKKLYESYNISPEKTKKLQIPELAVLAQEDDEIQYSTVKECGTLSPTERSRSLRTKKQTRKRYQDSYD